MKIGIDISQIAHDRTGVANYVRDLVRNMILNDKENEYVLFFSSLRKSFKLSSLGFDSKPQNVTIKTFKFPPIFLERLWNKFHHFPIENFIGDVDIFITSDWIEPPTKKAKKVTILYDLVIYKYPEETHSRIVSVQKRKLQWAKKESDVFICISQSTKEDAIKILDIPANKLKVIHPGI